MKLRQSQNYDEPVMLFDRTIKRENQNGHVLGMWWCSGLERQRFRKKAMRLWFRNPAEPVKNL